jgi:hypothetical protein
MNERITYRKMMIGMAVQVKKMKRITDEIRKINRIWLSAHLKLLNLSANRGSSATKR